MRVAWQDKTSIISNGLVPIIAIIQILLEIKVAGSVHKHETHISTMMDLEGKLMSRAIQVSHELLVRETSNSIVTQRLECQITSITKGL